MGFNSAFKGLTSQ